MTRRFLSPILILFILVCAGCLPALTNTGGPPSSANLPAPDQASGSQGLLEAAETAYNHGQYREAVDNYKRYLQNEPQPPRLESVLAGFGLAAEKAGQFQDAAGAYERLITEFPAGQFTAEARPRLAEVYLASGNAAGAAALATELLATETAPARQAQLRLTLAQSQWATANYQEAAGNYLSAWRGSTGQVQAEAQEGVLASLTRLGQSDLEAVQRQYGQNFPGPEATYLLARLAAQAGDVARTTEQADYFNQYFSQNPLQPHVAALLQTVKTPGAALPPLAFNAEYNPQTAAAASMVETSAPATMGQISTIGDYSIAVILPMSADGASKYAQEAVSGLKLAVNTFAGAGSLGLTLMDTKGSPEEAARLVAQAAADPKVLAVVGPFLSRESALAAEAAERAGLPLIAISQRADLTRIGPHIFRLFLTPRHQAEAVARYAVRTQGHQALGILYPEDNFGRPIRGFFEAEVQRLGAQLTVADSYDPQSADFSEAVARLTGGKAARQVSSSYQAHTDFTALYLPDSAAAVSQILPLMAFHDVTKMQYLGSPLWLNQEFLTSSSRYVQGAVIPVAVSDLSQREETRRFIAGFQSAYGHAPDQFAAYGYDAGLAVIKALGGGAASRGEVRQALAQGTPVPGATGPFSFGRDGEYLVDPTLLTVKDRAFVLLREPAHGVQ